MRIPQTNFSRGELSPALYPQSVDATRQGCVELENAIITPVGGVKKRTGFAYDGLFGANTTSQQLMAVKFAGYDFVVGIMYDSGKSRVQWVVWRADQSVYNDSGMVIDESDNNYLKGWDEAHCEQVQYVQTEDSLYVCSVLGTAPVYRIGKKRIKGTTNFIDPTEVAWWEAEYLGENARIGDAPIHRVVQPPFELTIDDDYTSTPVASTDFSVVSPVPLFSQQDENSIRPWMFTFPDNGSANSSVTGTMCMAYCRDVKSPTRAEFRQIQQNGSSAVELINNGTIDDWYGPWVNNAANTFTGMSLSAVTPTTIITATFASSSDADKCRAGDILNFQGGTFTHVAMLVGRRSTTTFDALMIANDGVSGTSALSATHWQPKSPLKEHDLFCTSFVSGGFRRVHSLKSEFYGNMTTQTGGIERPGLQIEFGGGLLQASGNGNDSYQNFQFEDKEAPRSFYPTTKCKFRGDAVRGWSKAVEFHQDRLFLSGNDGASVLASRTGYYNEWNLGSNADDALLFKVAEGVGEEVRWLASAGDLLIGTCCAEFAMSGALTPTNVGVDRQSNYGGRAVQPVKLDGQVFFVEASGKTIRATQFRYETEQYVAQSITDLAEHLFDGVTIRQMVHVRKPDRMIMAVLSNGNVLAFSYRPDVGVAGWSRWTGLSNFVSMTSVRGMSEDQVYAAHAYNSVKSVARFTPSDGIYLDFWTNDGQANTRKTHLGLSHLEDLVVQALVRQTGATAEPYTYTGLHQVDTGSVTLTVASNPFESWCGQVINFQMIPFPPEARDSGGTTLGQSKTYQMARVRVRLSRDVRIADRLLDSTNMPADTLDDPSPPTSAPPLKGGWYTVRALQKAPDDELPPKFESLSPYLCEFNAVVYDVDFGTE